MPNETTVGENFTDRWNTELARAKTFYEWHAEALADFKRAVAMEGMDRITSPHLGASLGGVVGIGLMTIHS